MSPPKSDKGESGFIDRFERAMEGTDTRVRALESGQAVVKQELKSLKEDRCDKNEKAIDELFNSRNELTTTVERLKGSASGLTKICESLDITVAALDKRALLLGKGEESVVNRLELIGEWNVPERLQDLEARMTAIQTGAADNKSLKFMLYGALVVTIVGGAWQLLYWYLTGTS